MDMPIVASNILPWLIAIITRINKVANFIIYTPPNTFRIITVWYH